MSAGDKLPLLALSLKTL